MSELRAKFLFAAIGFLVFLMGAGLTATASISSHHIPTPRPNGLIQGIQPLSALQQKEDIAFSSNILSKSDVQAYKKIFDVQKTGDWDAADTLIDKLENPVLMGYVLYQRYMHPTAYRSDYVELRTWLEKYRGQPGADDIYRLASRRHIKNYKNPLKPLTGIGTQGSLDLNGGKRAKPLPKSSYTSSQRGHVRSVTRQIYADLNKGRPTAAWKKLNTKHNREVFDAGDFDRLRADIAQSYFFYDKADKAFELAHAAYERSGIKAPLAGWVAGLISWQKDRPTAAAIYFESVAETPYASPWMVSAGAYWAFRAHKESRNKARARRYLKEASHYPYTFYGVIAYQALKDENYSYQWHAQEFSQAHFETLEQNKVGRRVLALLEVGKRDLAEKELKQLEIRDDPVLQEAILALAHYAKMPSLSLQLAGALKNDDGSLMDPALYPGIPWTPKEGFEIDRALVKALVRQESRFDPAAISHSGAVGLMQLMPVTASYVAGETPGTFKSKKGQKRLQKPEYNLSLGQKYVATLLRDSRIDGDLFKLMISYNAGPGRMSRWMREIEYNNDPLLFIESIPAPETRVFVERVMTNYWIYRIRMGQELPSLSAVIDDQWPIYLAQDIPERLHLASGY